MEKTSIEVYTTPGNGYCVKKGDKSWVVKILSNKVGEFNNKVVIFSFQSVSKFCNGNSIDEIVFNRFPLHEVLYKKALKGYGKLLRPGKYNPRPGEEYFEVRPDLKFNLEYFLEKGGEYEDLEALLKQRGKEVPEHVSRKAKAQKKKRDNDEARSANL